MMNKMSFIRLFVPVSAAYYYKRFIFFDIFNIDYYNGVA